MAKDKQEPGLDTVYVRKGGKRVPVRLRPISADELKRRREAELEEAERAQAEQDAAAEAGSPPAA